MPAMLPSYNLGNLNRRSLLRALAASSLARPLVAGPLSGLPVFKDITAQSGITFRHNASRTSQKYLPESMSGGVAMLDSRGGGKLDLFFVNGAALLDPMPAGVRPDKRDPKFWNRLYRNNGDATFTDVTERAGIQGHSYGMGIAIGDYDNDGLPDIYVTNLGENILYHNNGDGTFTDVTAPAGVAAGGWSAGACFFDYNGDGRLDLFVTRYVEWDFGRNPICGGAKPGFRSYCHPDEFQAAIHILYHNNGDGTFSDVSAKAGLNRFPGKGLGVAVNDYDHDGWPEILVANDSFPQQLFRNNRDGTFTDIALDLGIAYDDDGKTFAGMGVDFADYNNDGWADIFVNALANQRYALYRNNQGKSFDYVSGPTGIAEISQLHSGWGTRFFDYDNDGWKDLFVGQGHVMDNIELTQPSIRYQETPLLLHNSAGRFTDVSASSGEPFKIPLRARGVAFGDLNNDGFIDVAINCNDGAPSILLNQAGNGNHWLMVQTIGVKSNRDGIGARLKLIGESGNTQFQTVSSAGSYLSASDKRAHFGLGFDRSAKLLEITWPSGTIQQIENIKADRVLTVHEPIG